MGNLASGAPAPGSDHTGRKPDCALRDAHPKKVLLAVNHQQSTGMMVILVWLVDPKSAL